MKQQRICITGGAGFIGNWIAKQLAKRSDLNYELLVVDSFVPSVHGHSLDRVEMPVKSTLIAGDVRDKKIWKRIEEWRPTILIHLAAETGTGQSMYSPSLHTDTNVNGTAIMSEVIFEWPEDIRKNLKVVLASSRAVYGEGQYLCKKCGYNGSGGMRLEADLLNRIFDPRCPSCQNLSLEAVPTKESLYTDPQSIYGMTKLFQERLVNLLKKSVMNVFCFRFQNVYGEGQSLRNPYTGIIGIFASLLNQKADVRIFEDGLESRDFIHVEDVANAVLDTVLDKNIRTEECYILNVGTGNKTTVYELASEIARQLDRTEKSLVLTGEYRNGDIRHCYADIGDILRYTSWKPQINLAEGIRRYLGWFRSQNDSKSITEDTYKKSIEEMRRSGMMGRA